MKNKLTDLNNILFEQLERLNDADLTGEAAEKELGRAKAIYMVSSQVIATGRLILDAQKHVDEYGTSAPALLGIGENGKKAE